MSDTIAELHRRNEWATGELRRVRAARDPTRRHGQEVTCDVCGESVRDTRHRDVPAEKPDYCSLRCLQEGGRE